VRYVHPVERVLAGGVFLAAVALYFHQGGSPWLALILALAPDLSALGFAISPAVGVATYNAAHRVLPPLALIALSAAGGGTATLNLGLIWLAHIAADRVAGYGLKDYPPRDG